MKRDALDPKRIAAEIDMRCKAVNAIMQVRTTDKGYPTILDEVLEIVGYNDLLTRTETAEQRVTELEAELAIVTADLERNINLGDRLEASEQRVAEVKRERDKLQMEVAEWRSMVGAKQMGEDVLTAQRDEAVAAVKERDAALAQMRGALEAARVPIKGGADGYSGFTFSEWIALLQCVDKALSSSLGASTLEYIRGLEGLLRDITQAPQEMQDMMRREGFAIDNLDDRWQKLAFTLYTRIVTMATEADAHLKGAGKDA